MTDGASPLDEAGRRAADERDPAPATNGESGAPFPSETDYGAGPPPADQDPGLPAGIDIGQPAAPDDYDGQYGHTQAVIEPKGHDAAEPDPSLHQGGTASLGEWDAAEDDDPIPPRGWLLGNVFCRRFVSSLVSPGGEGKTSVRIAQALSLASGRSITGEHVFQQCRVLLVCLEDDKHELRRRVRAACIYHQIFQDNMRGWLFLATPDAAAGRLMVADELGRPKRSTLAESLEQCIANRGIDLVVLDPFVKSHAIEENNNTAIDAVVQLLTDLATKYDIAVDTPHHMRKGASAMKDAARLVYTLARMSPEEAQTLGIAERERRYLIRMDSGKVNIAPPLEEAKWFRLVSVPLGNASDLYPSGDEVQTVEIWTPPDAWADMSAHLLNRILDDIAAG